MSILGAVAGGLGSGLVGSLFGGDDDEKKTQAQPMQKSGLQTELEKIMLNNTQNPAEGYQGNLETSMPQPIQQAQDMMGGNNQYDGNLNTSLPEYMNQNNMQAGNNQYEGQTNITPSETQQNITGQINSNLENSNYGMSDEVMQNQMSQMEQTVNDSLNQNFQSAFENMNKRGIMDSDITGQNLNKAQQEAGDTLSDRQSELQMQNEQMKREDENNALQNAMSLSDMEQQQQQQNIGNQMQQWQSEQDLEQQDIQNLQNLAQMELSNEQQNTSNEMEKWLSEQDLEQQDIQNMMNAGQFESQLENQNIDRALENFYNTEELRQQDLGNAMNLLTGATIPFQQANSGIQQQNAQQNAEQESGLWGALGNIGGNIMNNWSQSWFS